MFKRIFGLVTLLVALALLGVGADVALFFSEPLENTQPRLVEVTPGTSFDALSHQLVGQHIIANPRQALYLSLYARLSGRARHIKSGEYLVPATQRPAQLVALLVSGRIREHRLTIVDGWRFGQIMAVIDHDAALKHTLTGKTPAQIMAALGHPGEQPQGRFMPDTYFFPRGESDVVFLKRAYNAMHRFLARAWKNRAADAAVHTPYQALILASIIEKETAVPAERGRISGVYSRRLEKGMRLQADPTVIYGMPNHAGPIHIADLKHATPYNTYVHYGLPPTPIAVPSRASIRAALHPDHGKALYFVSRGNGTHQFSDTLAEQNRAVQKYQRGGS